MISNNTKGELIIMAMPLLPTMFMSMFKSVSAGMMSLVMTMASFVPGSMGECMKLQAEGNSIENCRTELTLSLEADKELIELIANEKGVIDSIPEIPGIYENGKVTVNVPLYVFTDAANERMAISFDKELTKDNAIYLDTEGIAIPAGATKTVMAAVGMVGDEEYTKIADVYTKYFPDNGMYITYDQIFGVDDLDSVFEDTGVESAVEMISGIVNDVIGIMSTEENVKNLVETYEPIFEHSEKYFSEVNIDGVKGYTSKMTGTDILVYASDIYAYMFSEEFGNASFNYFLGLVDDVDYLKYIELINSFVDEEERIVLPDGTTNEVIASFVKLWLESEIKDDFLSVFTNEELATIPVIIDYLATGNGEETANAELKEIRALITPFMENSYTESTIYKKDGAIVENTVLSVSNGEKEYLKLSVGSKKESYNVTVAAARDIVPFDKIVEFQEIDNKLGYEAAVSKGVSSIDISWDSYMFPDDSELYITAPYFCINYNSAMIDSLKNDPEFLKMTPEEQELLIGTLREDEKEYKYSDTRAELIDERVYLPLRQLMENAGYEVSWDSTLAKAYVTVDGQKIEMSGIIIDDRTYVKVRDFEKLGAVVEYKEEVYYHNAFNDFNKTCYATITFAK